jgi:hypothetical protein
MRHVFSLMALDGRRPAAPPQLRPCRPHEYAVQLRETALPLDLATAALAVIGQAAKPFTRLIVEQTVAGAPAGCAVSLRHLVSRPARRHGQHPGRLT